MMMKTVDALFQQYGRKFVEVEIIAADFLGMEKKAARETCGFFMPADF